MLMETAESRLQRTVDFVVTDPEDESAAQGWIDVDRSTVRPGPLSGGVVRVSSAVRTVIDGRVARVEVEEQFRNGGGALAEGDPVPRSLHAPIDIAVRHFRRTMHPEQYRPAVAVLEVGSSGLSPRHIMAPDPLPSS